MTDKELADRLGDKDEKTLRQMAWRHGYGNMSSHYLDRVQNAKGVTEYRNVVTPRDEAHYRELMKHLQDMELDPTNRRDSDLMAEIRRRRLELRAGAEQNIKREGFIGKKMEYNDFLQNKLDSAIQEYDTPEKQNARAQLMKKYLSKGGTIEKVPVGQKAFIGKKIKPAFKKDKEGTPATSPGSDESAIKEDVPFGSGMSLVQRALMNKWITADEWFHLKDEWHNAADEIEQRYSDWPDGEGFRFFSTYSF